MTVRTIIEPTVEPLSLTEAKLHLREDLSVQDTLITSLIVAARQYAELYTGRAFVQRTLELTLSCFEHCIALPFPPLASISSVKYIDTNGALQMVSASDYQVDTYAEPGLLKPAYGVTGWPSVRSSDFNAVQVRYVAGYAPVGSPTDYASGVPEPVKQWMRVRIAQLYEHREAIVAGTIVAPLPRDFVDGLLDPYRVGLLG